MISQEIRGPCLNLNTNFPIKAFYDYITNNFLKDGMNIAEIGVFMGQASIYLASKIKENGLLNVKLYAVDHFSGSLEHIKPGSLKVNELDKNPDFIYNTFIENVNTYAVSDVIVPVRKTSTEAASTFDDNFFDLIYIDAGHTYDDVKNDITAWKPKLKVGGIIGGDDYGKDVWTGVYTAVNEMFGKDNVKTNGYSWYVQ
jgi:predicted O-methyltransferase YrrM